MNREDRIVRIKPVVTLLIKPLIKAGFVVILAVFALSSASAYAEIKVAVVDVARAVLNSEIGRKGMAEIQANFAAEEERLQEQQKNLTASLEKLKKDTEFMSEQEFNGLLEQVLQENSELTTRAQNLQRIVEESRQRLVVALNPRVREAIESLVKKDDYDIILPRAAAVYVGDFYDITLKLTEAINAQEKTAN